jgi:hypothetical protein
MRREIHSKRKATALPVWVEAERFHVLQLPNQHLHILSFSQFNLLPSSFLTRGLGVSLLLFHLRGCIEPCRYGSD